jgi:hypothetical protein
MFAVVFLHPRTNAELRPKFYVAIFTSRADPPTLLSKSRSCAVKSLLIFNSSAHNKVHFPTLYLLSHIPLPEERKGTDSTHPAFFFFLRLDRVKIL